MNTPNPLIPQGAFPENRGKSHLRIAVFTILAIHLVLLGGLMLQGCKRTGEQEAKLEPTNALPPWEPPPLPPPTAPSTPPPVDTGTLPPPYVPPTTVTTPAPPVEPTVPPPLEPPVAQPSTEHVVVKGDTFVSLAKKYGLKVKAIAEANPGVDPSRLRIGQKLAIPAPAPAIATGNGGATSSGERTYVVKSGDTLLKVARIHGTSVKALRSANKLRTDQIKVGQKLRIPAKSATPSLEPPPDLPGSLPPGAAQPAP